jgi:hypothetical protein
MTISLQRFSLENILFRIFEEVKAFSDFIENLHSNEGANKELAGVGNQVLKLKTL